jgi:hypothetical protein
MVEITAPSPEKRWIPWTLVGLLLLLTAAALLAMGRDAICPCGTVKLWHGTAGAENSQHLTDWYTPSHVLHGFAFYFMMLLLVPRASFAYRLLGAVILEAGWELVENTPWLIERYRGTTVSLDYHGDSVINSMADLGFMMLGFWLASRLPVRAVILIAVAAEAVTTIVIRDSLLLNILMLLWPLDAVLAWQSRA